MKAGILKRGIQPEDITVIPNAADMDIFDVPASAGLPIRKRLQMTSDQPLIVYTGTFGFANNVGYLVEIATAMRTIAPEVRFLLIGTGKEFEQVRARARVLNLLDQSVFIWEPKPKTEVAAILAAATLTTSIVRNVKEMWNNSANKFFDSLAAGRPIAINHGGWQADLLQATGAGLEIAHADADLAAAQLHDFLSDDQRIAAARAAAQHLAKTRYDRDLLASQWIALLEGLVNK